MTQDTSWIDAAIAAAVPELANAQARLIKAEQSLIITKSNADSLKCGFSEGRMSGPLLDPKDYDPDAA